MLEMLWDSYTIANPIDTHQIRGGIESLRPIMDSLSWERQNELFDTVSGLCVEHEKAAFVEGLRTGAELMMELERKIVV